MKRKKKEYLIAAWRVLLLTIAFPLIIIVLIIITMGWGLKSAKEIYSKIF